MDLKKLKEALNTLERYRKCISMESDYCDGACSMCPWDFTPEDMDNSVNVAITVISDVIKNMEKLKNRQI